MEYMWSIIRGIDVISRKFQEASGTGDFSKITQEEKDIASEAFIIVTLIWKGIMLMASCYMTYPLLMINKYVLARMTNRPFIWLDLYYLDFMIVGFFLYAFGWHVVWLNAINDGL